MVQLPIPCVRSQGDRGQETSISLSCTQYVVVILFVGILLRWFPAKDFTLLLRGNLIITMNFPSGASGKEPSCQCRRNKRCGFDPWIRKIPWRRAWQPTLVFLPGESRGQRSLWLSRRALINITTTRSLLNSVEYRAWIERKTLENGINKHRVGSYREGSRTDP